LVFQAETFGVSLDYPLYLPPQLHLSALLIRGVQNLFLLKLPVVNHPSPNLQDGFLQGLFSLFLS
jgi:hypothetical protein